MSTLFGYDSDQIEELELKLVNFKTFISQEELATAISASTPNGFIVTQQDDSHDNKPHYIFQKETIFKYVEENGVRILEELFPRAISNKNTLHKLTNNCAGKGLEDNACVFGVEVHAKDSCFQAIPVIKILMNAE